MKHQVKFYSSCGHERVEEITAEEFARWAAPRVVKDIVGPAVTVQNVVTTEGDARTVHVHPDRYCICKDCMAEMDREYEARVVAALKDAANKPFVMLDGLPGPVDTAALEQLTEKDSK